MADWKSSAGRYGSTSGARDSGVVCSLTCPARRGRQQRLPPGAWFDAVERAIIGARITSEESDAYHPRSRFAAVACL